MKTRKRLAILTLLVCILIIFTTMQLFAESITSYSMAPPAKDATDGLLPDIKIFGVNSSQTPTCSKYKITNYMFDMQKPGLMDMWAYGINAIVNAIFVFIAYISYLVTFFLMAAFKLNIFYWISGIFDTLVWAVRDAVFWPLITPLFAIIGLAIIINAAIGRFTSAWKLIMNTLLILVVGYIFLAQPSGFMNMINDASEGISGDVLKGTASVAMGKRVTSDDAVVNLANIFFESTVVKPWQIIEFGNVATGDALMSKFLQYSPSDDARKSLVERYCKDNDNFKPYGSIIRLVKVLFFGLLILVLDIFVLILAGLVALLQFAAIAAAMMLVLMIVVALLPNMGFKVVLNQLINVCGFLFAKIAVTLLICVYFAMNLALYRMTDTMGWFFPMFLQVILIVAIVLFRDKIMGVAKAVPYGQQRAIENANRKIEPVKDLTKTTVTAYATKKMYDDVSGMIERRKDAKMTEKLKPVAQDYLVQRYTNEKKEAEAKARANGKEPDYSDFVKRVDGRVDKGFSPFEERDIDSTVNYMKELSKQGNDPKNLLTTKIDGVKDSKIRMKQRDLEKSTEETKDSLEKRKYENADKINRNVRSNSESKIYDHNIEKQVKREDTEKERASFYADYSEQVMEGMFSPGEVILGGGNASALDEIRNDKIDREYKDRKKKEFGVIKGGGISPAAEEIEAVGIQQEEIAVGSEHGRAVGSFIKSKSVSAEATVEPAAKSESVGTGAVMEPAQVRSEAIMRENDEVKGNIVNKTIENTENIQRKERDTSSKRVKTENVENVVEKGVHNVVNLKENVANHEESITNKRETINKGTENVTNKEVNKGEVKTETAVNEVIENERVINRENVTENNVNRFDRVEKAFNKISEIVENEKNREVNNEAVIHEQKNVENINEKTTVNRENITEKNSNIINHTINEKNETNEKIENIKDKKVNNDILINTTENKENIENVEEQNIIEEEDVN